MESGTSTENGTANSFAYSLHNGHTNVFLPKL
jgi:hypothetical protein